MGLKDLLNTLCVRAPNEGIEPPDWVIFGRLTLRFLSAKVTDDKPTHVSHLCSEGLLLASPVVLRWARGLQGLRGPGSIIDTVDLGDDVAHCSTY